MTSFARHLSLHNSPLWSDAYKFFMALAGMPLRRETFVFSMRKGGPWYVPFDINDFIQSIKPRPATDAEKYWIDNNTNYGVAPLVWRALEASIEVDTVPPGSWVTNREPIATVTSTSVLASNIEAKVIGGLHFRIQVATLIKFCQMGKITVEELQERIGVATCEQEKDIILEMAKAVGYQLPFSVEADPEGYVQFISARAEALASIVGQDSIMNLAEGGMRAASCEEQHHLAVFACKAAGFRLTSNVALAMVADMIPAGTTGHEHQGRWGSDIDSYRAARDMGGETTFLLDTYHTTLSGIPSAQTAMLEAADRYPDGKGLAVRPDHEPTMVGDWYAIDAMYQANGLIDAKIRLSGGFNIEKTKIFETMRKNLGRPEGYNTYLYGQFLVQPHVRLPNRGDVGAVYKLSQTGTVATMKFSDTDAKKSSPGRPVIWRLEAPDGAGREHMPIGFIAQKGEVPPEGYYVLNQETPALMGNISSKTLERLSAPIPNSPQTEALIRECEERRRSYILNAVSSVI